MFRPREELVCRVHAAAPEKKPSGDGLVPKVGSEESLGGEEKERKGKKERRNEERLRKAHTHNNSTRKRGEGETGNGKVDKRAWSVPHLLEGAVIEGDDDAPFQSTFWVECRLQ